MGMGDGVPQENAIALHLPGISITGNSLDPVVTQQPYKKIG